MRELEGASEAIAAQVLDFLLFLKQRHSSPNQTTQAQQTVLERMGGVPKYLLSDGRLSDRDTRRAIIAERIRQRYQK
ncbi:MAG: hypothetical protein F6K30_21800 [Cyanothece sp. SIO2G6]|nr:hypothetical protein [Cyanothece sp. SIO2G6]